MKARASFTYSDGSKFECNLSGRGPVNICQKCDAVANRLEKPGRGRELERWTVTYRETIPGREFVRVNSRWHVSGTVYLATGNAHIIKRLR